MTAAMLKLVKTPRKNRSRGQGLVETAIMFPLLLIVLSGMVEFGFMLNEYLALQDASRNAARFASDGLYYVTDSNHNCSSTQDFYRQTACLVNQELAQERPEISIDVGNGLDDIIVSGFSVAQGAGVVARHPDWVGENGWSQAVDVNGSRNQNSRLSSADISARTNGGAPSTGLVSVEIFHAYEQKLKLPWITAFLSDPVMLHNYAIMPLVSAEPEPAP
jgi:hypothetical protein